jgi:5-methylthioadenosine/S-adenosylhomocysteine deaminase
MADLLIAHADYVVTVDRERRIIRDGAVAVTGGRIAAVGKTDAVAPRFPAADLMDARGKLVLPGLVDTRVLGPNLLLLHMGWVDTRELLLLKERDVKVSLSPGATFHQAMGNIQFGKAPEMLALGVTVSLGSDAAMSGNFVDVIRQTFLLVGGYHEARLDPKVIRPETAVEMITTNGARSLGWEAEIGSLEVGKRADLTILDILRPAWQPARNPIANLVYSAHGGSTDTVIADGKVVMRAGRIPALDEANLYKLGHYPFEGTLSGGRKMLYSK